MTGMPTVAVTRSARSLTVRLTTTRPTEFIDITDQLHRFVRDSGVGIGVLLVIMFVMARAASKAP